MLTERKSLRHLVLATHRRQEAFSIYVRIHTHTLTYPTHACVPHMLTHPHNIQPFQGFCSQLRFTIDYIIFSIGMVEWHVNSGKSTAWGTAFPLLQLRKWLQVHMHACLHPHMLAYAAQHEYSDLSLTHTHTADSQLLLVCYCVFAVLGIPAKRDINPIVSPWGTPALYQGKNVLRARPEAVTKLHKRTCLPHQSAFPKGDKGADIRHGRGFLTTTIVVVPARGYAHANEPWLRICPKCCNMIGGNSPACILCFTSGVWVESQFTLCFHSNTN